MELHVSLDGRNDLAGEIYRQLLHAISGGRLRPGERLPPTRELARQLNVSRTTVTVAYERLIGEGFLIARVGAGTFVSEHVVGLGPAATRTQGAVRARAVWDEVPIGYVRQLYTKPAQFDFRPGIPDSRLFPYDRWRRLLAHEWRAASRSLGVYGDPAGHEGLRRAIARQIGVSRGISAVADDVTVTSGTQQALDIVARALLAPGDEVAVEDPGYPTAWRLFKALGARVSAVPVDREGLVVDALPPSARLVYVTPSHQYPLGPSMSLARRVALLTWAQRNDAAIIEDDYDSEFRFAGRPLQPLQTLDANGRVIYVGSFSKTLLPTLRLGFVVAPPTLSAGLVATKYLTDWHTRHDIQAALATFIDSGDFARHLRKMRASYEARHARVVDVLRRELAEHLVVVPAAAGLHVCALACAASSEHLMTVIERASASGVEVDALSRYSVADRPRPGLVIGFGAITIDRIGEGLRRLRRAFEEDA